MTIRALIPYALIAVALPAQRAVSPADHYLKQIAAFDLPGPGGKRFDYLTIDADDGYLLSAHLGAGQTYVINLADNTVVATVRETPGAEGVEYVPELKKFYTSNAGDNTIGVVDLKQMKVVKNIPTESKPDGSAYAAPFHKLYVSDERGKAEAVVDVRTDTLLKTLHFESETGMPQYDPVARKVYVNLQDQNLLAVIDPATDTVVDRYPVGRCKGNHGMALDPEHGRAFLACEGNELDDGVRSARAPATGLSTRGLRSRRHQVRPGTPASLRGVRERRDLDLRDRRGRACAKAGRLPRAEARPQPRRGPSNPSCVRAGTGTRRRASGKNGRVPGREDALIVFR